MVVERIDILLKALNIKQKDFCDEIGISTGTIAAAKSRGNKLDENIIAAILETHPNLNARWLLLGEGEMWLDATKKINATEGNNVQVGHTKHHDSNMNCNELEKEVLVLRERVRGLERELEGKARELESKDEIIGLLKSK